MKRDPLLIGISGTAGSGKDTLANYLCQVHRFERYAFADPLRNMLLHLLQEVGIPTEHGTERGLREQPIAALGVSFRHMMQTLGTEWGRVQLDADFWIRIATQALGLHDGPARAPVHDRIVITDVRYLNEAAWVDYQGGYIVRLNRPGAEPVRAHSSEQRLHAIEPWAAIGNTGTLADLYERADELVNALEADAAL